ncbi:uncharacterized protein LOC111361938 [Spodoptera litura]|uniref:Uncharacterized protein LOC111361938 n=1 Tax=Spodoptera litura TaxID=69820 RepID=A0A9J7ES29_SPOLT|nr:uncharacterized protein LOC111361938 [Spodoptera litura]
MKVLAVVLLVAVAAAVNSYEAQEANVFYEELDMEESDPSVARRLHYQWGSVGPDDRLISATYHEAYGMEYQINDQEVTYRGNEKTNITSIIVREYLSNYTTVTILDGGLYRNHVTLGLKGLRSLQIGCHISIYATVNCSNM